MIQMARYVDVDAGTKHNVNRRGSPRAREARETETETGKRETEGGGRRVEGGERGAYARCAHAVYTSTYVRRSDGRAGC